MPANRKTNNLRGTAPGRWMGGDFQAGSLEGPLVWHEFGACQNGGAIDGPTVVGVAGKTLDYSNAPKVSPNTPRAVGVTSAAQDCVVTVTGVDGYNAPQVDVFTAPAGVGTVGNIAFWKVSTVHLICAGGNSNCTTNFSNYYGMPYPIGGAGAVIRELEEWTIPANPGIIIPGSATAGLDPRGLFAPFKVTAPNDSYFRRILFLTSNLDEHKTV
jgi:hypothetical protein